MSATLAKAVTVINPVGLHARPAAELARLAGACASTVTLVLSDGRRVDASSVLMVMASAIACGTELTVECVGDDAERDLAAVVGAIRSGLGE